MAYQHWNRLENSVEDLGSLEDVKTTKKSLSLRMTMWRGTHPSLNLTRLSCTRNALSHWCVDVCTQLQSYKQIRHTAPIGVDSVYDLLPLSSTDNTESAF